MYILALEMASPGNQHCASCIGTLSLPVSAVYCGTRTDRGFYQRNWLHITDVIFCFMQG